MTGAPAPAVLVMGGFIVLLLLWLVHHLSRRRRFPLVFEAKVEHACDGDSIIVRGRFRRVQLRRSRAAASRRGGFAPCCREES